jgi:hypothetical protein
VSRVQVSMYSRDPWTAADRRNLDTMLAGVKGISSLGMQRGRIRYTLSRIGDAYPDGSQAFQLIVQRGREAPHYIVNVRAFP